MPPRPPISNAPTAAAEIVIGLVGAVGTDLRGVATAVQGALATVGYSSSVVKLSRELSEIPGFGPYPDSLPEDERYAKLMRDGTRFRARMARADALAVLGMRAIRAIRAGMSGDASLPSSRHAYILHSLKNPAEVTTLRRVYGRWCFVLAAYSPRDRRVADLASRIAASRLGAKTTDWRARAEELVARDEAERDRHNRGLSLGQNVQDVFPVADAFVDASDGKRLIRSVDRVVRLLFGYPFHTPSPDEQGMFYAKAAALRSSALGRQVGAAITTPQGDLVVVGTNEVPKAGGGLYWEGDDPDDRDFAWTRDVSDERKRQLVADVLTRLREKKWLAARFLRLPVEQLLRKALDANRNSPLRNARLMDVLEFVRAVHAEMAALTEAARRGVAVHGHTLYVTTFPCHECARLIVSAGIARVYYIEPYPKSLAAELYPGSVLVEGAGGADARVRFDPFIGIAPRRYTDFFEMQEERKDRMGRVLNWDPRAASPRVLESSPFSVLREEREAEDFAAQLSVVGLQLTGRRSRGRRVANR